MICSAKKGISALQFQRGLEIGSYRTAWFMAHRIRLAMQKDADFCQKFSGIVEVYKTYIVANDQVHADTHSSIKFL